MYIGRQLNTKNSELKSDLKNVEGEGKVNDNLGLLLDLSEGRDFFENTKGLS